MCFKENVASIEVDRIRGYSVYWQGYREREEKRRFEMPVNSGWWRHKIWNALRKWQSWGRRHKQTHKSGIDRHIDDCGDRQAPSAIAIFLHLLCLSFSLCLYHNHLVTLILASLALLCLAFATQIIYLWFPSPVPRVDRVPLPQSIFLLLFSSLRPREKVFALSLPFSGCVLAAL